MTPGDPASLAGPPIRAYLRAMTTRVLDLDDHSRLPWRFHGRLTGRVAGA